MAITFENGQRLTSNTIRVTNGDERVKQSLNSLLENNARFFFHQEVNAIFIHFQNRWYWYDLEKGLFNNSIVHPDLAELNATDEDDSVWQFLQAVFTF